MFAVLPPPPKRPPPVLFAGWPNEGVEDAAAPNAGAAGVDEPKPPARPVRRGRRGHADAPVSAVQEEPELWRNRDLTECTLLLCWLAECGRRLGAAERWWTGSRGRELVSTARDGLAVRRQGIYTAA